MKRRTTAALIGLFVLIGISLLIAGIVFIGGGKYFGKQVYIVCYFDGSINGLQIGSPVKFRGAKIGEVSDIRVQVNGKTQEVSLPVVIELEKSRVYETEAIGKQDVYGLITAMIQKGLRAQLNLLSIVTGQLYVELDFYPETAIKLREANHDLLEIPTIPSSIAELSKFSMSARQAFDEIQNFLKSKDLKSAINHLSGAMESGQKLLLRIDQRVDPLTAKTENFLDQFSDTLRSIRVFTDYLSRHPEAFITGKYRGKE